jgi:DNA-binding protein HU-beta
MKVGKSDFVSAVAAKADLSKSQAAAAVDAFIDVVTESLKKGEDVQFTGFGKFSVQQRSAREGINPQTKEKIKIAACKVPKFSAGSQLKGCLK